MGSGVALRSFADWYEAMVRKTSQQTCFLKFLMVVDVNSCSMEAVASFVLVMFRIHTHGIDLRAVLRDDCHQ